VVAGLRPAESESPESRFPALAGKMPAATWTNTAPCSSGQPAAASCRRGGHPVRRNRARVPRNAARRCLESGLGDPSRGR